MRYEERNVRLLYKRFNRVRRRYEIKCKGANVGAAWIQHFRGPVHFAPMRGQLAGVVIVAVVIALDMRDDGIDVMSAGGAIQQGALE